MLKLRGLYYITHIDNLTSIIENGILCHTLIDKNKIRHTAIYDEEIIAKRRDRTTPDGRSLWDFVNLYFQPRNAMLYRVTSGKEKEKIIIIGLKPSILRRKNIFITTGNAASNETVILPIDKGKKFIDTIRKEADKEWWTTADGSKRKLMAECLVPDRVFAEDIQEIYTPNRKLADEVKRKIRNTNLFTEYPIIPQPDLFFLPTREIPLTDRLHLVEGDMFFSRMHTLTISVNTKGVMGKGLASRAKYQFPDVYVFYQDLCKRGELKMGKPYLHKREESLDYSLADEPENLSGFNLQTWFLLFPTKNDWRNRADIGGIEKGLKWLLDNYGNEGIKSLAIPALGCGLGWLEWRYVGPILCKYLSRMEIPVKLYLPLESGRRVPDEQLSKEFLIEQDP